MCCNVWSYSANDQVHYWETYSGVSKNKYIAWLVNILYNVYIQSNLLNSMFSRLKVLFRIISSLNYRELDIKIYSPEIDYHEGLFYQT